MAKELRFFVAKKRSSLQKKEVLTQEKQQKLKANNVKMCFFVI